MTIYLKRMQGNWGQRSLVKFLLYTHEDLSPNLWHPYEKMSMVVRNVWEAETGSSLGLGSKFFQIGELQRL